MKTIELTVSKIQVARAVVDQLRDYFNSNSMPRVIGLDEDGEVTYWHKVHGTEDMILHLADTEDDGLWGDDDPRDPGFWNENQEFMVRWFQESLIDQAERDHNERARDDCDTEIELVFCSEGEDHE